MNITEFLEARIAAGEWLARKALETVAPDEWENPTSGGNYYPADVAFWDQQTPALVLADCAAKRAIIGHHIRVTDIYGDGDRDTCSICTETGPMPQRWPCFTVKSLASTHKEHPDYQQEWAA